MQTQVRLVDYLETDVYHVTLHDDMYIFDIGTVRHRVVRYGWSTRATCKEKGFLTCSQKLAVLLMEKFLHQLIWVNISSFTGFFCTSQVFFIFLPDGKANRKESEKTCAICFFFTNAQDFSFQIALHLAWFFSTWTIWTRDLDGFKHCRWSIFIN